MNKWFKSLIFWYSLIPAFHMQWSTKCSQALLIFPLVKHRELPGSNSFETTIPQCHILLPQRLQGLSWTLPCAPGGSSSHHHCNSHLLLQHRSQSSEVFSPVLINIANQCKKNLPDLICQNTYGHRVKCVFLHFMVDAKVCWRRPEEQLAWEFWHKRWAHHSVLCEIGEEQHFHKSQDSFLTQSPNPWTVWIPQPLSRYRGNWNRWNQRLFLLFSLFSLIYQRTNSALWVSGAAQHYQCRERRVQSQH